MNTQEAIQKIINEVKKDKGIFIVHQSKIATEFKDECQRFMRIKNSQILNVVDLDTIASNAAKNFLNRIIQD
jgi:ABC-type Na+ transport system ATPase subunit NatA